MWKKERIRTIDLISHFQCVSRFKLISYVIRQRVSFDAMAFCTKTLPTILNWDSIYSSLQTQLIGNGDNVDTVVPFHIFEPQIRSCFQLENDIKDNHDHSKILLTIGIPSRAYFRTSEHGLRAIWIIGTTNKRTIDYRRSVFISALAVLTFKAL